MWLLELFQHFLRKHEANHDYIGQSDNSAKIPI